jgi:cytochrome c2
MRAHETLNGVFRMRKTLLALSATIFAFGGYTLAFQPTAQVQSLPGSVRRGEQLLREKGCLDCHALKGTGGTRAPDFAGLSANADSPVGIATAIWNHGPRMLAEYGAAGKALPTMTQNEVSDLFSFFFATLYFEPHGSSTRGREVFVEKNCSNCHSEVLNAEALNPFLNRWTQLRDPTSWAERFWNHVNEMESASTLRGVRWPELSARDVADLMTFLSTLPAAPTEGPAFAIGEPLEGKAIFERSCETCHTLGTTEKSKVNLLKRSRQTSVAGYIASMWNHAPMMRRRGGALPRLASGEMQDVIAYLFLQQYFYEQGDAARGKRIYDSKGCAGCHEGKRAPGAPDLAATVQAYTPISMAGSVWRHGSGMRDALRAQGKEWPRFQDSEMTDLMAYLNSRLRTQIAR